MQTTLIGIMTHNPDMNIFHIHHAGNTCPARTKPGTALERLNSQLPTEILPHSTSIEWFVFMISWIFITNYILTT